ncbi:MAG: hypothetical protein U0T31_00585 [Chitinophagales bacterium]
MQHLDIFEFNEHKPFLNRSFDKLLDSLQYDIDFISETKDINDESGYCALIKKLYYRNRISDSIIVCKRCLRDYKDSYTAHLYLAMCFWEFEDRENAALLLAFALQANTNTENKIISDFIRTIKIELPVFDALVPVKSDIQFTSVEISETFLIHGFKKENNDERVRLFYLLMGCELNPKNAEALIQLSSSYINNSQFVEAIHPIFKALENTNNTTAHSNLFTLLGIIYKLFDFTFFSKICFNHSIKLIPNNKIALHLLKDEADDLSSIVMKTKDIVYYKFLNPYFYSGLLFSQNSRLAIQTVAYIFNSNIERYNLNIITTLSAILENEFKETIFKHMIGCTTEFNERKYNNLPLQIIRDCLTRNPKNLLTGKTKIRYNKEIGLQTHIANYFNCQSSMLEEIGNIVHTIIPIRNNVTHGTVIKTRDVYIFLEFSKLLLLRFKLQMQLFAEYKVKVKKIKAADK